MATTYKNINMKFSEEDWQVLNELKKVYDLDQTNLIRNALRHVLKTQPVFEIKPQSGKFVAHAAEAALSPAVM
ncbi:MAG TPA: hypothetical protein PK530_17455 [Anaerolineales bacterium]|jgi:flagellar basal body-associated protein FliL|nr:hypothetical protein [Anaerolineales bacterium]